MLPEPIPRDDDMSVSTVCPGCGQRVQPPEGYQRRKLQCPACGVMCELPEPVEDRVTASPRALRLAPRPPIELPPAPPSRAATGTAPEDATLQACRVCGEPVRIAGGADSKLSHCPVCGTAMIVAPPTFPPRGKRQRPKPAPPPRSAVP